MGPWVPVLALYAVVGHITSGWARSNVAAQQKTEEGGVREIKFRALVWDEWDDGPSWLMSEPLEMWEIADQRPYFEFANGRSCDHSDLSEKAKIRWLQYTGLKDKNGVEIYEGDIVDKGYSNLSTYNEVSAVKWGTVGRLLSWRGGDWAGWITDKYHSLLDIHRGCSVIGNIHENPELLED